MRTRRPAGRPHERLDPRGSDRHAGMWLAAGLAVLVVVGCAAPGHSNRVLWRVASPDGQLVAVCQEVPVVDGPSYDVRLERPDGTLIRRLYGIGDGDPCNEVVWSPDARTIAVLSGRVARMIFVDVAWALAHPDVETAHWSWRQVSLSSEQRHVEGSHLRFVGPTAIELRVCQARSAESHEGCPQGSATKQVDIPLPIVTGHGSGRADLRHAASAD